MQAARKLLALLVAVMLVATALVPPARAADETDPGSDTAKWMVNDAEVVVAINIKQMVGSAVMKKGGTDAIKAMINGKEEVKNVLEATGIDPLKDIHSITVSGAGSNPKDVKALVVVRGKFDLDKVHGAAEKFSKKNPDELKLSKSDTTNLYEVKVNDMPMFAAFIDSTALVMTPSKEATLDAVKNAGKKAATINKTMKPAMAKFDGKDTTVAIALVVNDELKKALGKVPQAAEIAPKVQTVTGTVSLTDSATTTLTVNTDDSKAAGKVLMLVKQLKALAELMVLNNEEVGPVATEMLNALKITQDKGSVTASLKVTKEMIEKANKKDK